MTDPTDTPAQRNTIRERVAAIAVKIEKGEVPAPEAARELKAICADDAADLDMDEIHIDFDTDGPTPDPSGSAALSALTAAGDKPAPGDGNTLEDTISRLIRLRDRMHALAIVGNTPDVSDRERYTTALTALKDALNTRTDL